MATELLDHYVDRQGFISDTEFAKEQFKEVLAAFTKLTNLKLGVSSGTGTKGALASIKELNRETEKSISLANQSTAANNKKSKSQNDEAKATRESAKAAKEKAAAEKIAAKEEKERLKIAKEAEAQAKRDKAILDGLSNDYTQLSKAYADTALKAKNYSLTLGETHPVTVQAVADAKAMADILKRVDASVGQFGRNVGNYADGFSGLRNSFNQVGRELPALAINTQTFLLAISNNLPILADEIGKAKVQIKSLQEAGKPTPSLFQAIAGAVFSWQTALTLGITALTLYGPKLIDFISDLADGSSETKKAAKALDMYTKAMDAATEATDNFKAVTEVDFGTITRGLQNQLAYSQAQGKSDKELIKIKKELAIQNALTAQKEFNATEGAFQLDKLKGSYEEATDALAAFQRQRAISGDADSEAVKEVGAQLQTQVDSTRMAYEKQESIVQKYYDAQRDLRIVNLESEKQDAEEIVKLRAKEFDTRPLEDYRDALLEASQNDDLSLQGRLQFRQTAADTEKEIIQKQYDNEVAQAKVAFENIKRDKKSSHADLINAQLDYNESIDQANRDKSLEETRAERQLGFDLVQIRGTYIKKQLELEKQANDDFAAQTKERRENAFKEEEDKLNQRQNKDGENLARALAAIDKEYATGKLNKEQYEAAKLKTENKYRELSIRAEIQYLKNILDIRKNAGFDVSEQLKQIAELERQLGLQGVQDAEKNAAKKSELLKQLQQELGRLFLAIGNSSFEKQKNDIQDQIDLLEKKKQAEIEAINATTASEEEKANKIAILNARAAAQKEQLELRQRQIQQQQARFQKAATIAQIIASTAQAVVAALGSIPYTPANISLAYLTGAIGAAQLATALATPIPKYKHGIYDKDSHPGGWALVNDGGKREVIVEPGQAPYVQSGWNQLVDLRAGTQVYPDLPTFEKMNHQPIFIGPTASSVDNVIDQAMLRKLGNIHQAIKDQPIYMPDGNGGMNVKRGNDFTHYINKSVKY